jgi:hypothetical protein
MTPTSSILLQQATADQDTALRELSQLDSARAIGRPALMAIVDGRLVAAASLRDGRIVADPFASTEQAVKLLRMHTAEVDARRAGPPRHRRARMSLRARPAM